MQEAADGRPARPRHTNGDLKRPGRPPHKWTPHERRACPGVVGHSERRCTNILVLRLKARRPTFAMNMTDEEREI